jgi:hypothetical protein
MDFGIAETGFAHGSPPGTTTEVLRVGFPIAEFRFVSQTHVGEYKGCTGLSPPVHLPRHTVEYSTRSGSYGSKHHARGHNHYSSPSNT